MKSRFYALALVGMAALGGCDKVAPPVENPTGVSAPAPIPPTTSAPAFSPRLLESPVLGVYSPGVPYSIRSSTAGNVENGGKASMALEFWGATVDEVDGQIREKFLSSGFTVADEKAGYGSRVTRYAKDGHSEVLVNVSPIGSRNRTAPGSVGTIYFEWIE